MMSIEKYSSSQLNNILDSATAKLDSMNVTINDIKDDVNKKLLVMRYENQFISEQMDRIQSGGYNFNQNMKILTRDGRGQFDSYGSTIHPKFITSPWNVFNLKVSTASTMFFRSDVAVKVNGVEDDSYLSMLKHDSIANKGIFFNEFLSSNVVVDIIPSTTNKLGSNLFNMIEIDPFMAGSFDIKKISIYGFDTTGNPSSTPLLELDPIVKAGKCRITLPDKYNFSKVTFTFNVNFNMVTSSGNVFPFGLKHIYLYDADFITSSYAVVTLTSDKFISTIESGVIMKTLYKEEPSSFDLRGLTAYTDTSIMDASTEVLPSTQYEINEIAKNLHSIYVKIPINKESLIGTSFTITTR
jgi:hypothetical protein